jgi:hypothetical protein
LEKAKRREQKHRDGENDKTDAFGKTEHEKRANGAKSAKRAKPAERFGVFGTFGTFG